MYLLSSMLYFSRWRCQGIFLFVLHVDMNNQIFFFFQNFEVFVHPIKDRRLTSFKLELFWGDDPLRQRWTKYIIMI